MRFQRLAFPAVALSILGLSSLGCRAPAVIAEARMGGAPVGEAESGAPAERGAGRGLASKLTLSAARRGVRIDAVDPTLTGAELLDPGDIIEAADSRPMRSTQELDDYLASLAPSTPVLLRLSRGGRTRFVGVQTPPG